MNVLVVSPFVPYPLDHGGKTRVFRIVEHLARRHRVSVACLAAARPGDLGPLPDLCDDVTVVVRTPRPPLDLVRFLAGGQAYNVRRFASARFREALARLATSGRFDVVHVELPHLWPYAAVLAGIPVTLGAQNVEHEIVRQIGCAAVNPVRHALHVVEARRLARLEAQAWRECRACFAVSARERDHIAARVRDPAKVVLAPNGVDVAGLPFSGAPRALRRVLHLGGLEYAPNLDAARYLIAEIWPRVAREAPDATLDVVGRDVRRLGRAADVPGVTRHESPRDVAPFLRSATLLAVPLRLGGGTRLKILEAMAAGLPVVTTTKGAEGLDLADGVHARIADDPSSFARAIVRTFREPGAAMTIAENARALVEQHFAWDETLGPMEDALARIVAGGAAYQRMSGRTSRQ